MPSLYTLNSIFISVVKAFQERLESLTSPNMLRLTYMARNMDLTEKNKISLDIPE
ncbi:hypothetical protein SAMN05216308_10155 [Nitrosospira sp. Nsp13]|nr:hypothetical protein SAMN05216308_10155 [Nitrosospira sp. Nsp13]